mmetsp:Transcript_22964/g.58435  ORF Transcript_22964/g.58435 Transcript_22964/m.58435 type:complete len:324 (+) Transcript_22964:43-1014(+)|eukprot:CAMPEP_0115852634 /NCGR_PEP_ID=MMETSP0287-20121206/13097_1 /TAXON_ID=412157 /ORGANISM="Chrysochromulina rotalis, Strain UIO044" /LENGTH=323 /DNA_ID=CAMNT_0003306701 /DNA_START=40 /DNA_END=1011 /DNA_ORIENTATION=+
MESAELTAGPLPPARATLAEWLWGVHRTQNLHSNAKLMPLLHAGLPRPEERPKGPLKHIDSAGLTAFELKPAKPPTPSPEHGTIVASGAPLAAPAPDKDIRQVIWELAHKVHEHFSYDWPPTWERPPFANDPSDPQKSEWMGYPDVLVKSAGCKDQLVRWKNTPETPPLTKEALGVLVEKLQMFVNKRRKQREGEKAKEKRDREEDQYQQALYSFHQSRQHDIDELQLTTSNLRRELENEMAAINAKKLRYKTDADMTRVSKILQELIDLNAQYGTRYAAICARVPPAPPASESSSGLRNIAGSGHVKGPAGGAAGAQRPRLQ